MVKRSGLGEVLVVWGAWAVATLATIVTYAMVDPDELYNVTRTGLGGGLSRGLVQVNYPIGLVAIAIVLIVMGELSGRAWWIGGPAIAFCALVPFVVDQNDLDARWANLLPALGVGLAVTLSVVAALSRGASLQPRRPGDGVRMVVAVVVAILSLPWLSALVGIHLPGDVFMGEELFVTSSGKLEAAVHLGAHHGLYGALLLLSALALSRTRQGGGRIVRGSSFACVAALAGYGTINFLQDLWLEQGVKRGWVSWRIPSAVLPGLNGVTLVAVALSVLAGWLFARERAILRR